jgi:predicted lysophospholipase L1 biosynthesis ABC-type transport system permease subunit
LAGLRALEPTAQLQFVLARFSDDVDPVAGRDRLRAALADQGGGGLDAVEVEALQRSDDIRGYERVSRTPLALAALLVVLAGGTTAHALIASVRRRRRDLAILKTLGFVRGQIRSTVALQATVLVAVALAVGLPLGVAAGRWVWSLLAEQLGAVPEPVIPVIPLLAMVPVTLVVANLVAALPARSAARTQPASVLRAE